MAVTTEQLEGFRQVQRLAYRCAEEVAADLVPGTKEKQAAAMMKEWLLDHGVEDWFHLPFAWFGARTAFRGIHVPLQFFPSNQRLNAGDPFILDCAPVLDGFTADIGYTGIAPGGENPMADLVLDGLAEHRQLICEQVRERMPLRAVYENVDAVAARQGFENRHRKYPFHVIGHKVWSLPPGGLRPVAFRFGLRSVRTLIRTAVVAGQAGWSPLWAGGRWSDHRPVPGLWAIEPHLGFRDVGAKFEEILVVTEDEAYWLDEDLPHVRRWAARGVTHEPAPTVAVGARPSRAGTGVADVV